MRYALQTHNDATGATVAVAEAACPPNAFFFPSAKAAEIEAINGTVAEDFLENLGTLQNQLMLTCDHHHKTWVPALPTGGCKTRKFYYHFRFIYAEIFQFELKYTVVCFLSLKLLTVKPESEL